MSRGIVILIVVLCAALAALLIVPRVNRGDTAAVATTNVAVAPPVSSTQTATTGSPVRPINSQPARTNIGQVTTPTVRTQLISRIFTVTNDASVTNMLADPPPKTLPELERDYSTTTNRDTRLDAMMDIAEQNNAEAVKSLTRLFELETNPDLKVDLLDSLLGIEGFKDEKLVMLTLGIRQGLPGDVRQSAIDGLIDIEDTRSIPLLNGLLNDPDPEIRQSAQDAIEILQAPPPQIPKLK